MIRRHHMPSIDDFFQRQEHIIDTIGWAVT
ncbi:hypothetical protein GA0070216_115112 [Micromonospora matsumotoense]|uniref:Uncharacterized protein n=1 Tax=Micromonospora matsumotoense TaxID=121616 RepID=A0A1C5ACG6_9ACTN|nr:hypothetical protein GA0070216_115112 [Micromonospora matsumotoense]